MSGEIERVSPLSFGQISILRSLETIAKGREEYANVWQTWSLPPGTKTSDVQESLTALVRRHESLRCVYDFSQPDEPQQIVQTAPQGNLYLVETTLENSPGQAKKIAEEERRKAFDITVVQPWKFWILHAAEEAQHVVLVMHHIAVDATALDILKRDFYSFLGGSDMPKVEYSPTRLAMDQHSEAWKNRRIRSSSYLQRVMKRVGENYPPDPADEKSAVAGTFISRSLKNAVKIRAEEAKVSESNVLLAAYSLAVHQQLRPTNVPLNIASANRHFEETTDLVGSLNQWTPLICDPVPSEGLESYAKRIQKKTFAAYQNGCYHPTDLLAAFDGSRFSGNALLPGYYFNYIERVPENSPVRKFDAQSNEIVLHRPSNLIGPSFYLVAENGSELFLALRVMWNEFDSSSARELLRNIINAIEGNKII
ncbi:MULTISPECIES: condensation domain-containing protein [unclassified Nocardiopsis]|uniref:condensation domain-containing protein n=1 Tax=unclassified Nocardiopsis TaxID=2649073 RepID=UPI001357099A|nr:MULTISPECIES: condensation domain-containing protein [unclassified Nocardiopsis]